MQIFLFYNRSEETTLARTDWLKLRRLEVRRRDDIWRVGQREHVCRNNKDKSLEQEVFILEIP